MNSNELVYVACMCAHGVLTPHDVIVSMLICDWFRAFGMCARCSHGDVMMLCYIYGFFGENWHSALIVHRKNIEYG